VITAINTTNFYQIKVDWNNVLNSPSLESDNASWNESYADTKYYLDSNPDGFISIESDPKWSANFTNMQTDCPSDNYAYGVNENGMLKCRQDQTGSELIPVYLGSNLTATNADYTTIFTIALTPSKMNIIQAYLVQSSSTNGVAIQNRVIVSESGPIGNCHFVTQTQTGAQVVDNIVVSTNSADSGVTAMGLDTDVPFINTVTCTVLADANQKNLIIQFESETVATVTTYAGSYYINAVN
jgi:hypothetical protein